MSHMDPPLWQLLPEPTNGLGSLRAHGTGQRWFAGPQVEAPTTDEDSQLLAFSIDALAAYQFQPELTTGCWMEPEMGPPSKSVRVRFTVVSRTPLDATDPHWADRLTVRITRSGKPAMRLALSFGRYLGPCRVDAFETVPDDPADAAPDDESTNE